MKYYELKKSIVVGIDLYSLDRGSKVIQQAVEMASALDCRVHLVHVHQPYISQSTDDRYFRDTYWLAISESVEKANRIDKEEKLKTLIKQSSSKVEFTYSLAIGSIEEGLVSEAIAQNALMMILETKGSKESAVDRNLSTAFSLMSTSPIPVLVFKRGWSGKSIEDEGTTFFVCDNLEGSGKAALEFAAFLGQRVKSPNMVHATVHSGFGHEIKTMAKDTWVALMKKLGLDTDKSQEDWFQEDWQNTEELMKTRLKETMAKFGNNEYKSETKLLSGDVSETLRDLANQVNANIVCFGRHRPLHLKPFTLGRLSRKLMMQQDRPILIVPER